MPTQGPSAEEPTAPAAHDAGPRADVSALRCAVLGDPIAHSLSPVLHRAAYAEVGLAWEYTRERVPAGGLATFLRERDASWRGLSLTMPLKREVLPLLASISPRARLAGAVNTLVRTSYGWAGDNTDFPGAVAAVRARTPAPITSGAILGAGATAASTGLALAELGAGEVTLLARDAGRAAETAAVISAHDSFPRVRVAAMDELVLADILVSTIPATAQTADLVERWRHVPVLFEVVYDPWPTPLLEAATGISVSGLDLLVHQAALQFELFTGAAAPIEVMRTAGRAALGGEDLSA